MKRNRMKKVVLPLMVILAVVILFVGCNRPGSGSSGSGNTKFPSRAITIIVPNSTGGGSDLSARAVARFGEKYLGVPVIVDNRPGGGQTVAHTYFKSAPKDGYTLIVYGNSGTTVAPFLQRVEYDPFLDEEPIGRITNLRNVLLVHKNAPYNTLGEFITYCQTHPNTKLSTSGANGIDDLTAYMINLNYNTGIIPVAYDSGGEAVLAVVSGEVAVACTSLSSALPQIDAGTTKVLSFVCDVPDPAYPQYKTAKELGYNISLNNSIGLAVHPSVDPEIKKVLSDWLAKLPNDPEYQKLMSDMGLAIDYLDSSDFLELTETEIETVKAVLAAR